MPASLPPATIRYSLKSTSPVEPPMRGHATACRAVRVDIIIDGLQQCVARWSGFCREARSGQWLPHVAARVHPEVVDA